MSWTVAVGFIGIGVLTVYAACLWGERQSGDSNLLRVIMPLSIGLAGIACLGLGLAWAFLLLLMVTV